MRPPVFRALLDDELIVDSFAGGGGASEGIHQARASSDTHQDILSLGIMRRKSWLASQQRREVYKRLLMYNFDLSGKKIARYVPHLNLGLGDGFPLSADSVAKLASAGFLDPSQHEKIDERIGLPRREKQTPISIQTSPTPAKPVIPAAPATELPAEDSTDKTMKALGVRDHEEKIFMQPIRIKMPQYKAAPRPQVIVNVPPQPEPKITVNVPPAQITVNVPEQKPPQVNVNVPAQKAPVVNIQPKITVSVPKPDAPEVVVIPAEWEEETMTVKRNREGQIQEVKKKKR